MLKKLVLTAGLIVSTFGPAAPAALAASSLLGSVTTSVGSTVGANPGTSSNTVCQAKLAAADVQLAKGLVACERTAAVRESRGLLSGLAQCQEAKVRQHISATENLSCAAGNSGTGTGGTPDVDCGRLICTCHGDDDCNQLFSSGRCGEIARCEQTNGGGTTCACLIAQ